MQNLPLQLHFEGKKFWEISLLNEKSTLIRFGKLLHGTEVVETTQLIEKEHTTKESCLQYVERVTQKKYSKGYQQSSSHVHVAATGASDTESLSSSTSSLSYNTCQSEDTMDPGQSE